MNDEHEYLSVWLFAWKFFLFLWAHDCCKRESRKQRSVMSSATLLQNDRKICLRAGGRKKKLSCVSDGKRNQTTARRWKRRRRMTRARDWWTSWTWSSWTSWWVCLRCKKPDWVFRVKPKVQLPWKMNAFDYKQHPSGEGKQTVEKRGTVLVLLH